MLAFFFQTKTTKCQEVRVAYHGGITSPQMQHVFSTNDDLYKTWLAQTNFQPEDCTMHCEHKCHPHKLTEANSLRQQAQPRLSRRQKSSIFEYQKTWIHCAKEWALEDYHTHCYNDSILFKKAEYEATKTIALKTKGWAMKKAPPAVHFPLRIRQ